MLEALKVLSEEGERRAEHAEAMKAWSAKQRRHPLARGGGDEDGDDGGEGGESRPPVLVPNLLMLGLSEEAYLLKALSSVRATELEQALLLLPFESARALLDRLLPMVPHAPPAELLGRCVLFLVKMHHKQLLVNRAVLGTLDELERTLAERLASEQRLLGYNAAAMRCLRSMHQSEKAQRSVSLD